VGEGDRHSFRLIVAPEDADRLSDLRDFTRDVMIQMEADLGTELDWISVDHFNTGHPPQPSRDPRQGRSRQGPHDRARLHH
jgi:type IV secretory pathway VirD2 relaxase